MTEQFRKKPPAPLSGTTFNIPEPTSLKLNNGLKVVLLQDDRHPILSFRLAFHSGDINDPEDRIGLNSAMASLLSEGTEKHSSLEFAQEIERLGASLSAQAGSDNTLVRASTLSSYTAQILSLMSEMILLPTFPEEELSLYKQNTIEGLKFQRSQPDFLADEQVSRIIYGNHPYSINSPKPDDIEKIKRDDLVAFRKKTLVPNNATLIVVGDFEADELLEIVNEEFGDWAEGAISTPSLCELPVRTERSLTIVDRPGSTQSNIVLANLGLKRNHPDYFPVVVMNQVLGAGASSRLFMNLREEKGYTYGAYSRLYSKRHAGSFEATSEVRTSVTGESLKEFFFELNRIRDERVADEELADAKNYLAGVFPLRAETQEGLTGLLVSQLLYDLPDDYLETYRENVRAVNAEEVQRVAVKYIEPEKMALVIVGDAEEVIPQASTYSGTIEVFDKDGNSKDPGDYVSVGNELTSDFSGKWNLSVDAQGQALPVTLSIVQDNGKIAGKLESMLGEGEVTDGKVNGNKLTLTVATEFQGQNMEMSVKGVIDGDSIGGTISIPMMPEPLKFSGSRGDSSE